MSSSKLPPIALALGFVMSSIAADAKAQTAASAGAAALVPTSLPGLQPDLSRRRWGMDRAQCRCQRRQQLVRLRMDRHRRRWLQPTLQQRSASNWNGDRCRVGLAKSTIRLGRISSIQPHPTAAYRLDNDLCWGRSTSPDVSREQQRRSGAKRDLCVLLLRDLEPHQRVDGAGSTNRCPARPPISVAAQRRSSSARQKIATAATAFYRSSRTTASWRSRWKPSTRTGIYIIFLPTIPARSGCAIPRRRRAVR